ncbi:MAG: dihydropteroate synthase [Hymenobacteraceae bacterium]|nr:dihydropteroate synthase [Hymenobacteraceae bacterium]
MNAKDTLFCKKSTLNANGKILSLETPLVMGILNVTPDSFFEGNRMATNSQLLERAGSMLEQGATILDIGGYSTRPGAAAVSEAEERARVIPAIKAVKDSYPEAVISVDTFRAAIAEEAVENGASVINDVSGGELDAEMFSTAGKLQVPYILMHMRGTPQTMAKLTTYTDIVLELVTYFEQKVAALRKAGVTDIILDPGFGFAKTVEQNYQLLRRLRDFELFELPILAGLSRKSMTYKPLGIAATEALAGTIAVNTMALLNGADILRVHDVKEAVQTVLLYIKTNTA